MQRKQRQPQATKAATLDEILAAKEKRAAYQTFLLEKYNSTVIAFKLNIPGAVKNGEMFKEIFEEGKKELLEQLTSHKLEPRFEKTIYKITGAESFAAISADALKIKSVTTEVEETHPLGRIFDMDVINSSGRQIKRSAVGLEKRRCLLCENDAFICARSGKHSIEQLLSKIEEIWGDYVHSR